ncbi:MAG TPA: MarR family winged helix-turn-helix transcriptional regulator [Candidatus Binatia bacterium]|jgi:DNA-binding MarR family transcriptional regulator|nr:MarR family winged helix-turn-helix transcriptional regulator [Candidatus Binatia bacterium]
MSDFPADNQLRPDRGLWRQTREVLRAELERFFMEVNGLANHLKKTAALLHRSDGLPAGGQRLLQILKARGAQTVPAMARLSLTSRQNVQIVVNRLKAEGWIGFEANPAHKRSALVSLTEQGQALVTSASAREEDLWDRLLEQASGVEVSATTVFLQALREALAEPNSPHGEVAGLAGRRDQPRKGPRPGLRSSAVLPPAETEPERSKPEDEADEFPVNLL